MSNDKNFTRGYVKGWTDRHKHGSELPSDLSNAINELQRLLTREEAGLPITSVRRPVYVSSAKKSKVQRFGKPMAQLMEERKRLGLHQRTGKPLKRNPSDTELTQYVWEAVKSQLAGHGAMMPRDVIANLLAGGDAKIRQYIKGGNQRVGQLLIYYAKCDPPQVKRVSAGYELVNQGVAA